MCWCRTMGTSTTRTVTAQTGQGTGGTSHHRTRRVRTTVLGVGASALLALTACGGPADEAEATPTQTQTQTATATETATSTATATATETATSTATATATETSEASPSDGESAPGGEGTVFTAENGVFSWTLPIGWEATTVESNDDFVDFTGYSYEQIRIAGEGTPLTAQATLGVGPTDGDGAKPQIVEVLDTAEIEGVPTSSEDSSVWYRAILVEPGEQGNPLPSGDEMEIHIDVVELEKGVAPESTGEDAWSGWTYPVGDPESTIGANFIGSTLTIEQAEMLTGETGEEALRAVIEHDQYQQLKTLLTSMEVQEP